MRSVLFTVMLTIVTTSFAQASVPQDCPPGFADTGAHCTKPPVYGRGVGHWSMTSCERETGGSCEKCYSLFYPVCAESFSPAGCNICSPICPPNMTDIGLSCQK